jgi:hypothetical protein
MKYKHSMNNLKRKNLLQNRPRNKREFLSAQKPENLPMKIILALMASKELVPMEESYSKMSNNL